MIYRHTSWDDCHTAKAVAAPITPPPHIGKIWPPVDPSTQTHNGRSYHRTDKPIAAQDLPLPHNIQLPLHHTNQNTDGQN